MNLGLIIELVACGGPTAHSHVQFKKCPDVFRFLEVCFHISVKDCQPRYTLFSHGFVIERWLLYIGGPAFFAEAAVVTLFLDYIEQSVALMHGAKCNNVKVLAEATENVKLLKL